MHSIERIALTVNGTARELELDPRTPLLYVLRNDLGLKGPKYGCGLETVRRLQSPGGWR